jgi:glycolate oxidase FAD binding subunit
MVLTDASSNRSGPTELPGELPSSEFPRFQIDGLLPRKVAAPGNIEEMATLLQVAAAHDWKMIPFGNGNRQEIGNRPLGYDLAVTTQRLDQIPEYEPEDMVVKVQSGCRLSVLQQRLACDNLFLPIDPSRYSSTTLGGIVAANASGPFRHAHGTIRDHLLGLSLLQPDGTSTRFGGRVVKNVTGYDFCKLYTGSFGTLGIFVDFFFKLKAMPPSEKSVVVVLKRLTDVSEALSKLTHSPLLPTAVEFLNPQALAALNRAFPLGLPSDGFALVVHFGECESAVNWQVKKIEESWDPYCAAGIIVSDRREQQGLWETMREDSSFLEKPAEGFACLQLKLNHPANQLVPVVMRLQSSEGELGMEMKLKAHAGTGVLQVYYHFEASEPAYLRLAQHVRNLRAYMAPMRGSVVVEVAPPALKQRMDVWGYEFKDKALMLRIRERYDPKRLLNPGRFVV